MNSTNEIRQEATFELEIQHINLNNILVAYHPRKYAGDLTSLQESIRRDGLLEPLTVYPTGDGKFAIIDGLRRLRAVEEFGWESVPCIIKGVSVSEAAHLSYVRNAERAQFNPIEEALHFEAMRDRFRFTLQELEIKGYGSPTAISRKLKLLDLHDDVQALVASGKLSIKHGLALWELDNQEEQKTWADRIVGHDLSATQAETRIKAFIHKCKNGGKPEPRPMPPGDIPGVYIKDARDMAELPKKTVQLIVTSPPYHLDMEYEKGISYKAHLESVREVLQECNRVLEPGGIIALNVGDIRNFKGPEGKAKRSQIQLMGHIYQSFLRRHQILLTDMIMWEKNTAWSRNPHVRFEEDTPHTSYRILSSFEPIYIFRKAGTRKRPPEQVILQSQLNAEQWKDLVKGVWHINPVNKQEGHPCPYPEELVRRLVLMFSYEGDLVLDPWLGSGTTVKVARELGRDAVGYEREAQYKSVIMRKLGITPEPQQKTPVEVFSDNVRQQQDQVVEGPIAAKAEPMVANAAATASTACSDDEDFFDSILNDDAE